MAAAAAEAAAARARAATWQRRICICGVYLSEQMLAPRVLRLREFSLSLPIARSRSHCRSLTPLAECASAFRTLCNERVCPVQSQTNSRSRVNVQQIQHEGGGEEEQEKQQQNKN